MANDSYYVYSYAPPFGVDSGYSSSFSPVPVANSGYSFAVTANITPTEPFLLSVAPDPVSPGQILTITGLLLNRVSAVVVEGQGVEFTYVNPTTIRVALADMVAGPKSVYVEYV